jgi:hypothetical protein
VDNFNLLVAQAMILQRQREADAISKAGAPQRAQRGLRLSLASTFVRAGLRLDPAAGEGLHAYDVRSATQEGGC